MGCSFCGEEWSPRPGVDASKSYCSGCSEERRATAKVHLDKDGKVTVRPGKYVIRIPRELLEIEEIDAEIERLELLDRTPEIQARLEQLDLEAAKIIQTRFDKPFSLLVEEAKRNCQEAERLIEIYQDETVLVHDKE